MQFKIELEDEPFVQGNEKLYRCKGFKSLVFDENGIEMLKKMDINKTEDDNVQLKSYLNILDIITENADVECIVFGFLYERIVSEKCPELFIEMLKRYFNGCYNKKDKSQTTEDYKDEHDENRREALLKALDRFGVTGYDRDMPIHKLQQFFNDILDKQLDDYKYIKDSLNIDDKVELTSDLKIGDSIKVVINTKYDENEEVEFLVAYKDDEQIGLLPRYPFITKHSMNDINTTEGGYEASKMKTKILPEYEKAIKEVFENELVSFDLLSEEDVFDDNKKLELFKEYPRYINEEINNAYDEGKIGSWTWWLRSVVGSTHFAYVYGYGGAHYDYATASFGVRPLGLFALKK